MSSPSQSPPTVRVPRERPPPQIPDALRLAADWSWRLLAIAAVAAACVWLLAQIWIAVLPVVLALLVATILAPAVRFLDRCGWPRLAAAWAVFAGAVLVFVATIAGIGYEIATGLGDVEDRALAGVADIEAWLVDGPLDLRRGQIDRAAADLTGWLSSGEGLLGAGLLTGVTLAVQVLGAIALAFVLLFFFLKDGERLWGWVVARAGARRGHHVDEAGRRAWRALGGFIRGSAVIAAVDAIFIGLGILLLGVPLVVPLVALTFIGGFVPIVGATLAGAAAVLVALATEGVTTALILLAVVIGVQQLEGNVLEPVVMGRTVRLHPVVILLALAVGAAVAGVGGAMLAVPAMAAGSAIGGYVWEQVGPR